jgi:hypothetical protein
MTVDIVVTTCGRLPLLKQTLAYIRERTTSPYRLRVIDDASGNAKYVARLLRSGQIDDATLHKKRRGIPHQLRLIPSITTSDPVVFTDDDILCPLLEPDWLACGLEAMQEYPQLGLVALNSPQCNIGGKRGQTQPSGRVTFCRNVPGSFVFARRQVLETCRVPDGTRSPVKEMCRLAHRQGWEVGYLTHSYCQHIGEVSVRNGKRLTAELERVQPVDPITLAPPERYRG